MKKRLMVGSFSVLVALLVTFVGLYAALPANTQFELEGNATVEGPGDDWANTVPAPGPTSEALASTFVADGSGNATIFTTGGSKDTNDVSQWKWKDDAGGLPDKDNLTNAYAAAYRNVDNPDDLTIYFGADRFANDGDAQMGFWFFKQHINLGPAGNFVTDTGAVASHSNGDVLVLVNMSNGGAVASAAAFRWINGSLVPFATEINSALCGANSDPDLCVISNPGDVPAPWAYTPKQGVAGTFPTFSFIEGGVNINVLGAGGLGGCFSSFLAETRSSTSPTSTLKDFALGEFNTCDVDISKTCPTVTYDQASNLLTYTAEIVVTNKGFGTVFDVTVTDTPTAPGAPEVFTLATLATGASHTFTDTFTYTPSLQTPNPPSNTATVTAATTAGGPQVIDGGSATATCPRVEFDAALSITKSCSSAIEVLNGKLVVAVNVVGTVCNVAPGPGGPFAEAINGIVVSDTPPFEGGTVSIGTLAPGTCQDYSAKYYPNVLTLVGGNPSANPGDQVFTDTAAATGTGAVSGNARANTASATCPLCPPIH